MKIETTKITANELMALSKLLNDIHGTDKNVEAAVFMNCIFSSPDYSKLILGKSGIESLKKISRKI